MKLLYTLIILFAFFISCSAEPEDLSIYGSWYNSSNYIRANGEIADNIEINNQLIIYSNSNLTLIQSIMQYLPYDTLYSEGEIYGEFTISADNLFCRIFNSESSPTTQNRSDYFFGLDDEYCYDFIITKVDFFTEHLSFYSDDSLMTSFSSIMPL